MHQKGQGGFTLVELMIVVAIIGILAAVAIPQFAQYRIRGFNSSALSDVRNLTTAQEAFFADWLRYAVTHEAADVTEVKATGDLLEGPSTGAMVLAQWARQAHQQLPLAIGNGVVMQADVIPATAVSYVAISKHLQGNTMYGATNTSTAIHRDQETLVPGQGGDVLPITGYMPEPHETDDPFIDHEEFEAQ
ncbi:type IV pilin protein [Desulfurivibrio alkaliphilus]|nr:prepilin-type N-terminal cleavage/methylation domain-containing protein [Desulfurivibrio alkaliphilus]